MIVIEDIITSPAIIIEQLETILIKPSASNSSKIYITMYLRSVSREILFLTESITDSYNNYYYFPPFNNGKMEL